MSNKLKPALLGGLITGVLCVIPFLNNCCCIWAILGGFLAGLIYIRSAAAPVTIGEGAVVGVLSGVVGSVIYIIIGLPIALFIGATAMEAQLKQAGVEVPLSGVGLALLGAVIFVCIIVVSSAIGGLIAVPIFEKRKGESAPPPPPQNMGGGPGGFGATS